MSPSNLTPMLEAVAAASAVMPWGVSAIPSLSRVLIWDARPDASTAIIEAVAAEESRIDESGSIDTPHGSIVGVLVAPVADGNDQRVEPLPLEALEDLAGSLKLRYAIATGPDPADSENPW